MERTAGGGRGARRLLLALALAAGAAALAAALVRETGERSAPAVAPGSPSAGEPLAPAPNGGLAPPALELAGEAPAAPEEARAEDAAPAAAERVAAPLGPRGRVVDGETGAPVPDVVIERRFAGAVDHRASTGPDGVFAFGPEVNENGTLRAVKPGWRFTPGSRRPRHQRPGEELVFEGAHPALAARKPGWACGGAKLQPELGADRGLSPAAERRRRNPVGNARWRSGPTRASMGPTAPPG